MEFWEDLGKTVSETANQGAKKLTQVTELTKMKYHLGTLDAKKDKFFREIGSLVYHQYAKQTSETTKIAALCLEVDAIEKEMRETKEKIRKNSGKKVCSACGSTLAVKASFCRFCGAKQAESGASNTGESAAENDAQRNSGLN